MRIQKNRSTQKILIVAVVFCILLTGGLLAYKKFYTGTTKDIPENQTDAHDYTRKTDLNSPSDDQKAAGDEAKKQTTENTDITKPADGTLSIIITAANQTDTTLQLRTLIDSVISSGTCILEMTKGQTKVTRSTDIQALASNSTCKGFDLPLSELSQGNWNVKITVDSEEKGGSTEKVISIH